MNQRTKVVYDDSAVMSNFLLKSPCSKCARLDLPTLRTCTAFPDGIPKKIQTGENDHRKPVKGDDGLTFLQI